MRTSASPLHALFTLSLSLGSIAGAFAQPQAGAPWPSFGRDASNARRSPLAGPSRCNASVLWRTAAGGAFDSVIATPAVAADGTVFVGTTGNVFVALNGTTGATLWQFSPPSGGIIGSSAAIGVDGTVYFGSLNQAVYALDGATGAVKWTFSGDAGFFDSSPVLGADGTLYVLTSLPSGATGNLTLHALNASSGQEQWSFLCAVTTDSGQGASTPTLTPSGLVIIACASSAIQAVEASSGALVWSYNTQGYWSDNTPALGPDGTVYVFPNDDGNLYALDSASGALRWTWASKLGTGGSSPAVGANGTVYVGVDDSSLYALNGTNGTVLWSFATGGAIVATPAIDVDDVVYVGSTDGNVYALNGTSGALVWSAPVGGMVKSSPVLGANGVLFIGTFGAFGESDNVVALGCAL